MEKEKRNPLELFVGLGKTTKHLIIAAAAVLVAVIVMVIFSPQGGTTFDAEVSLKEVLEISDLTTAEYTYNSIVEVKEGDTTKYHVAYLGTVKVGVNFQNIKITQEDGKITLTIPCVEIQNVAVDPKMDYIFTKDKYNSETVYAEAYNACIEDLTHKASSNATLLETAKESAKDTVLALIRPFEAQLSDELEFEVIFADGI